MAAKPNFFLRILEVMWDESVGLCLTPQKFRNVEPNADIFNNVNQQFWQYVLPGCDALGYVACTGTNFCLRARCLARVGWFPEYTITEDYALSMELKMAGVVGRYLSEYLAVGEAPTEVRNVCRQRSRWTKVRRGGGGEEEEERRGGRAGGREGRRGTEGGGKGEREAQRASCAPQKSRRPAPFAAAPRNPTPGHPPREKKKKQGHMQIFFSWDKCPLLQWRLPLVHKLLYTNGTYAYFATIATSITFTLVPFVSLVFGLHPVAFSKTFAIAATCYLPLSFAVQNYARERGHLRGQWLASVSNQVLCFTYIKAVANTLLSKLGFKAESGFKATVKAGGSSASARPTPTQAVAEALRRAGSGVAAAVARAGSGSLSGQQQQQQQQQAPVLAAAAQQQQRAAEQQRALEAWQRRAQLARAQGLAPPPPPPGLMPPRPAAPAAPGVSVGPLGPVKLERTKSASANKKGAPGPPGAAAGNNGGGDDDDDDDDGDGRCWAWTNAKTLEGALDPLWLALSLGVSVSAIAAGATSLARSGSLTGYAVGSWREFAQLFSSGRLGVYTLVPMLWAAYNAVPPVLFFLYFFTKGRLLRGTAIVCQGLTFVFGAGEYLFVFVFFFRLGGARFFIGRRRPRGRASGRACFGCCCCCCCAQRSGHRHRRRRPTIRAFGVFHGFVFFGAPLLPSRPRSSSPPPTLLHPPPHRRWRAPPSPSNPTTPPTHHPLSRRHRLPVAVASERPAAHGAGIIEAARQRTRASTAARVGRKDARAPSAAAVVGPPDASAQTKHHHRSASSSRSSSSSTSSIPSPASPRGPPQPAACPLYALSEEE
jgi:hypothetical protein